MTTDLIAELERRTVLVDGAMGTMLIDAGLAPGTPPERWVLERPDDVLAVHRAYARAGAEVLTTCTFGANRFHLERAGLALRIREVIHAAVSIAKEASEGRRWIMGDIGPIWSPPSQAETPSPSGRRDAYAEQAHGLVSAGCDVLLIETMTDLDEALLALSAARAPGAPVIVTMSFAPEDETAPPESVAARLVEAGAAAVGVNCWRNAEQMLPVVTRMAAASGVPVIARPNAGQPRRNADDRLVYDETPERFAAGIARIVAAGARAVGGCCGTTPEMIAAARRAIDVTRGRAGA